jgi:conjugal transfer mating pair stabilization protein TraG
MAARMADGFEQASRREVSHLSALRNGHSWSSENSSGFDSSAGVRGGTNTEASDRTSLSSGSSVQNRDTVADGTRHQNEVGNNTSRTAQWSAGARVGVSVGGEGGGGGMIGKIASAVGLKADGSAGYTGTKTDSDTTSASDSANTSRERSVASSDQSSRDHSSSGTVSENDGTFHQSGAFSRSQNSESRTQAEEESLSRIQSYNEQARHYRELSQSLEHHASYAETHGFNMSQDLRQDLAQFYDKEMGSAPRGLLPGLWETNLSSTQEQARNTVIEKWAGERSAGIERDIQSALKNPALSNMKLPAVASEASVAGRYSGGGSLPPAHPVSSGKPSTAREDDQILKGASQLLGEEHRRNIDFRQSLHGAPAGPKVE